MGDSNPNKQEMLTFQDIPMCKVTDSDVNTTVISRGPRMENDKI